MNLTRYPETYTTKEGQGLTETIWGGPNVQFADSGTHTYLTVGDGVRQTEAHIHTHTHTHLTVGEGVRQTVASPVQVGGWQTWVA